MKAFLLVSQIAKLEDVSTMTVNRWIQKGYFLNVRKVGSVFRIPLQDYSNWRESTKVALDHPDRTSVRPYERPSLL